MFILTVFLILKLLSNPWDNLDAFLGLRLGSLKGWIYDASFSSFAHTIWVLLLSIIWYIAHPNIAACICVFCYCHNRKGEKAIDHCCQGWPQLLISTQPPLQPGWSCCHLLKKPVTRRKKVTLLSIKKIGMVVQFSNVFSAFVQRLCCAR